jgi:hypothetical protein
MATQKHVLTGNPLWRFSKPYVGFKTNYTTVEKNTDQRQVKALAIADTCRETVIYNTREILRSTLTNVGNRSMHSTPKEVRMLDLSDPETSSSAALCVYIGGADQEKLREFLHICDVVLGPVCVLLDPNRQKGTWWRTDPEAALVSIGPSARTYVAWQGSGNWFLAHPTLMAIATGLYRQCYQLFRAGMYDQINGLFQHGEVRRVMTARNRALALRMLRVTRPYIEVPAGEGGSSANYAFPAGKMRSWRRLLRLQRAVIRHGYRETFDQTFGEGWGLAGSLYELTGVYDFWGEEGELTGAHKHLMKVGAPVRKRGIPKRGGNVAKSITNSP